MLGKCEGEEQRGAIRDQERSPISGDQENLPLEQSPSGQWQGVESAEGTARGRARYGQCWSVKRVACMATKVGRETERIKRTDVARKATERVCVARVMMATRESALSLSRREVSGVAGTLNRRDFVVVVVGGGGRTVRSLASSVVARLQKRRAIAVELASAIKRA